MAFGDLSVGISLFGMKKNRVVATNTEQSFYRSREKLAAAGIHASPDTEICLSSVGFVESWVLDAEDSYEDCGDHIVCLRDPAHFERNRELNRKVRIIRSAQSPSLFAPEQGYRYDGEYFVDEMRLLATDSGTTRQPILRACSSDDPPARAPYDKLLDLAHGHGFETRVRYDSGRPRITAQSNSPISVSFESSKSNTLFAYLYVRTTSWQIDGERTDWHDVLTVLLTLFLRWGMKVSCSLWDQSNEWGLPVELYGRYVTFDQPSSSTFHLTAEGFAELDRLLSKVRLFEFLIPSFFSWTHAQGLEQGDQCHDRGDYSTDDEQVKTWQRSVAAAVGEKAKDETTANFRRHPDWRYYRNLRKGISLIEAPKSAAMFSALARAINTESTEAITTNRGEFLVSGNLRHFVSETAKRKSRELMARLYPGAAVCYLPIENMLLALSESSILTLRRDCGLSAFNRAKLEIRPRHEAEARLLFPPAAFDWSDQIDDDTFECMILDLLNVEPGVVRVRRTGASRDSDQGRDLIIDWQTPPTGLRLDRDAGEAAFLETRGVVGQCKASCRAIGKADVVDIRDTVAHHLCSGFFLATSLRVTNDLATHLDTMRARSGIWTEWWTRSEIELRLRAHPDIAARYPTIIKARSRPDSQV